METKELNPNPCAHRNDGWCMDCVKKIVNDNARLNKRIFEKIAKENPLSLMAKITEFIAQPLDCGHSIDCWDDEKEICELCETRLENQILKKQLKEQRNDL